MEYWANNDNTPQVKLEYARVARSINILYQIKDIEFLTKVMLEDDDGFIRDGIVRTNMDKIESEALLQYLLREDNSTEQRVRAAELLLKRDYQDSDGKLDDIVVKWMPDHWSLAFALGRKGDNRAVPVLAEAARTYSNSMTAPSCLGHIHTLDSVKALMELMETNQDAGDTAAKSLQTIYRNATDPAVKSAIRGVPQKTYYNHIDMGESGSSCHTDSPSVVFYLDEE